MQNALIAFTYRETYFAVSNGHNRAFKARRQKYVARTKYEFCKRPAGRAFNLHLLKRDGGRLYELRLPRLSSFACRGSARPT
jgi:hypothetical protein